MCQEADVVVVYAPKVGGPSHKLLEQAVASQRQGREADRIWFFTPWQNGVCVGTVTQRRWRKQERIWEIVKTTAIILKVGGPTNGYSRGLTLQDDKWGIRNKYYACRGSEITVREDIPNERLKYYAPQILAQALRL